MYLNGIDTSPEGMPYLEILILSTFVPVFPPMTSSWYGMDRFSDMSISLLYMFLDKIGDIPIIGPLHNSPVL